MLVVPFLARSTLKLERGGVWQRSSYTTSEGDDKASDYSGRRSVPMGPGPHPPSPATPGQRGCGPAHQNVSIADARTPITATGRTQGARKERPMGNDTAMTRKMTACVPAQFRAGVLAPHCPHCTDPSLTRCSQWRREKTRTAIFCASPTERRPLHL